MSRRLTIASIVEGYGDAKAVPLLIRRVAGEIFGAYDVDIMAPHRVPRTGMKSEPIRKAVRLQSLRVRNSGGLIVVADSDGGCPVEFARQVRDCAEDVKIEVAIAVREFEAWFLAAVDSLRLHRAVRRDAAYDAEPDTPRDAKGKLQRLMTEPYRETLHQPEFASLIDLEQAQRSGSFSHFVRCIGRIVASQA